MELEIKIRGVGLGYFVQTWPKAKHHILRIGPVESRVIVTEDGRSLLGIWSLMLAGVILAVSK